jgi:nicotinic acid mononucleotide adenylyltransferase
MEWIDSCRPAQQFVSHPITETVKGRIQKELFDMAQELGVTFTASPFTEIWAEAEFYLDLIASHLNRREIMSSAMTGSNEETEKAEFSRALRIGFFPVSADPFHWGHLLIGLSAMARFTLDKVIYVLSGSDERKPGMTPPGIRHPMGRSILNMFTPLFDYSSAALESDLDGESSLFKILASHQARRINAFYIAGADHGRRFDPDAGQPDTFQKIEEHVRRKMYGFDSKKHRIFMIFVKRGVAKCSVETQSNVSCMPGVPFEASSSAIRRALAGREEIDRLALLPHTAYLYIKALDLYTSKRQVEPSHGPLPTKRVA